MKKIIYSIVFIIILIAGGLATLPLWLPTEAIQNRVTQMVWDKTGRTLAIAEPPALTFYPDLGIELKKVSFSNATWAQTENPHMLSANRVVVAVQLLPLLAKEIALSKFIIENPEIHLAVAEDGRTNWEIAALKEKNSTTPSRPSSDNEEGGWTFAGLEGGEVSIRKAAVSYTDKSKNINHIIKEVDVVFELEDLTGPARVTTSAVWNGKTVKMQAAADNFQELLEGNLTPIELQARLPGDSTFVFKGTMALQPQPAAKGILEARIGHISTLTTWLGKPTPANLPEKFAVQGEVQATPTVINFENMNLSADNLSGFGSIQFTFGGDTPRVSGALKFKELDLRPYFQPIKAKGNGASAPQNTDASARTWSKEPLDFSALKAVNADIHAEYTAILLPHLTLGPGGVLEIVLKNGLLTADITKAGLYEGTASAKIVLDGQASVPGVFLGSTIKEIKLNPLLSELASFEKLYGTTGLDLQLQAKGQSEHALINALNGRIQFDAKDGTFKGANLLKIAAAVTGNILQLAGGEETKFTSLSAPFAVTNGVVSTDNLRLVTPALTLGAKGNVNLPLQTVDLTFQPLKQTAEGPQGALVPVKIAGNMYNPQFQPQLGALFKGQAGNDIKQIGQNLKENLQNQRDQIKEHLKKDPVGGLMNLLGR